MKARHPRDHSRLRETLRLQTTLYASRNPTRKWLHQSRREWIAEAIQRYFPVHGDIAVDAGTGSGVLLDALSESFHTVIGLDREPVLLFQARERTIQEQNLNFIVGDLSLSPLKNNSVDLVICSEVIEHVNDEGACLEETYRVLRPGGLLILTTPQPFSSLEMVARLALLKPLIRLTRAVYREPVMAPGHINLMSTGKLEAILSSIGFTILEKHKSGLYVPGLAEIPREWTAATARRLSHKLSGTKLDFLLWTQFFVVGKQPPPGRHKKP